MVLVIKYSTEFANDYKLCESFYGADNLVYLDNIIDILSKGKKLSPKYKDHLLTRGKWKNKNYHDCHVVEVTDDWVLIYKITKFELYLVQTGSHSKIFSK